MIRTGAVALDDRRGSAQSEVMRVEPYTPPYTITHAMLTLVARIAEKAGSISGMRALDAKPYLRRNNRIRSVHSSLAIEANSLSLDEVRGVIEGRAVVGPQREILEVRNAYRAYEMLGAFDPYSPEDLKRLHGVMTDQTIPESGVFRSQNEGVFRDGRCIFMAPPPHLVPDLTEALFAWMRAARSEVHALILSSVFHYEFVFIHPFADGNGRMARLWQTALLSDWNPLFRDLPLESRVHEFQEGYYAAFAACHAAGNADAFILFMLERIDETLDQAIGQIAQPDAFLPREVARLLDVMERSVPYTAAQLMAMLGLRSRTNFRALYLDPALERGLVSMSIPDRPTSRNQTYIRK